MTEYLPSNSFEVNTWNFDYGRSFMAVSPSTQQNVLSYDNVKSKAFNNT
jgi:hypothetical protein